jgi:hypothetical protein
MAQQKTNSFPLGTKTASSTQRTLSRPSSTPRPDPMPKEIANRAYEIFLSRGGEPGHDLEDWLQAEEELRLGRQ